MLELIGLYVVVSWFFSLPYIGWICLAVLVIGFFCAIGEAIEERSRQPINKELRGMTPKQRRQWAMREGPYA